MSDDERWMCRAIEVARLGLGQTAPNPSVGAVLVRDGMLLGEGHTEPVGGAHAERVALRRAQEAGHDPAGATLYVTLEPCCHHGRTPPCTDAILAAGIARVVVGVVDPFPPMQGRSLALLRDAGLDVALGIGAEAAAETVRGFTRAIRDGLPEVTLKVACTADGRIATADGESQWITGPNARADGHALRASHDGILVGIGTVLADNPRLTCRVLDQRDPVPVVLDTRLRIPADAALFGGTRRPVIVCGLTAPERDLPADIFRVPLAERGVDMRAALSALASHGIHRLLVEGGGDVHRSVLDAEVVDTVHMYLAGLVLPGGRSWVGGPPVAGLSELPRWGPPEVAVIGNDVRITWHPPVRSEAGAAAAGKPDEEA